MDELFDQFIIEGRELVAQAIDDLAALEREPSSAARIDSAFRAVHTLKGSVAIFDLGPMGAALHAAEDVLGAARSAGGPIEASAHDALVACIDRCDRWLDDIEATGELPADAAREGVKIARRLAASSSGAAPEPVAEAGGAAAWLQALVAEVPKEGGPRTLVGIRYVPREDCFFTGDDPLALAAQIPELVTLRIAAREAWPALDAIDPYRCNLVIEALSGAALPDVQRVFRFVPDQVELAGVVAEEERGADAGPAPAREVADKTIRVEASEIDRLLDLVGELVVAKNALGHLAREAEENRDPRALAASLRANHGEAERLIAALHRTAMAVRMVPLERTFRRLGRLVRETAEQAGRKVEFAASGGDTRIDKSIADALFEPLLHIVRNAIDHGIEPAERRLALGKAEAGALAVRARAVGDQISIAVSDDGAGIDSARVRQIAVERGLVGRAEAAGMSDAAANQLIFLPGFSTAGAVTALSGRGVGMDAVKAAVEGLAGRVSLASSAGRGTEVTLRLPAAAALLTVLVLHVRQERFAVPLDSVAETLRLPAAAVMPVGQGRAFVHRSRTLPLLRLADLLGLAGEEEPALLSILVVETAQGQVGIAVDAFSDRLNVMLRPKTGLLARLPAVSGTTLLGDGSVLLILDLEELIG
jgi:two-component system chemotaxis sensor kinase CheA